MNVRFHRGPHQEDLICPPRTVASLGGWGSPGGFKLGSDRLSSLLWKDAHSGYNMEDGVAGSRARGSLGHQEGGFCSVGQGFELGQGGRGWEKLRRAWFPNGSKGFEGRRVLDDS